MNPIPAAASTATFEISKRLLSIGHSIWWTMASGCLAILVAMDPDSDTDWISAVLMSVLWGSLGAGASLVAWRLSRNGGLLRIVIWSVILAGGWIGEW